MKNKIFAILLISVCILTGCKAKKEVVKSSLEEPKEVYVEKIDTAQLLSKYQDNIKTVSAQYQIYLTGNKSLSIRGMISSVKDESLTVSIQMLLGIEIARIHCTPDSIWALDKLGQKYYEADFNTFSKELGTDFYGLQSILINQPFDPEKLNFSNFTLNEVEGNYVLALNKEMYTEFLFEDARYLTRNLIKKPSDGSYLMTTYSSFLPVNEFMFPTKLDCMFQSKEKSNSVTLNYSSISINKDSNLTFSIPKNYRKADMDSLIKLVNQL